MECKLSATTHASLVKGGIPLVLALGTMLCVDFAAHKPPSYAKDVLPIATANLAADLIIICVAFYSPLVPESSHLVRWYQTYGLSAVIADTFIGIIYMLISYEIAQAVDPDMRLSVYGFLSIGVQWIGDLLFAAVFLIAPRGSNVVLDMFKDYAREAQLGALLGDSFLVAVAVLLAAALATVNDPRYVVYALLVEIYLVPYAVHARGWPRTASSSPTKHLSASKSRLRSSIAPKAPALSGPPHRPPHSLGGLR